MNRKKSKHPQNQARRNPSERILLFFLGIGIGAFLLYQLYLRWDTCHMLHRMILGCLGLFFLFLPISKRLCVFAAETLILTVLFSAVSPEFRNLWSGGFPQNDIPFPASILSLLALGIPLLLLLFPIFRKVRRPSISMSAVDLMSGSEFEQFCADILRKNGFHNVEVMGGSGDQGVDIVAVKGKERYAVQCKCYSSNLGNTPVQEVFAGKIYYECDAAAVMTNSYFTAGAIELAESTGVLLWDRDWVYSHLSARSKRKESRAINPINEEMAENGGCPASEIESTEKVKTLTEIQKSERERENQEEYLRGIWGEELKWRRQQLNRDNDEQQ